MTIAAGDIKLLASKRMTDDSNGGGGPTSTVIPDGASNAIFGDVTEVARAGGKVSIRQVFLGVRTLTTDEFMDSTIIVAEPPNDPNVSITLAKCETFSQRSDIANTIESYLIQGPEWGGYLLENHVEGQRALQIFQRRGTPTPPIGRTLCLVKDEGLLSEVIQYVRVTDVNTEDRVFTYMAGGGFIDFEATVVTVDLSDALRSSFPGSPPNRAFSRDNTKTVIRDTTVADAATYYGASPVTLEAGLGDIEVSVSSVYSQLVPSSRTETIAIDQRPSGQRSLTLATTPREVVVGVTPHSRRIKVGQENRGFSFVEILEPFPAPGTLVVSFMALGNWYTLLDDGAGNLTGSGSGTVNYANGSVAVSFLSMPDVSSSIIFSWGERSGYTNRSGSTAFRPPEFVWDLPQKPIKADSVLIEWTSGGVAKSATDSSSGVLSGDATGEVNYAMGRVFLRPSTGAMIDAGGEFNTTYTYGSTRTEHFPGLATDFGGFASIILAEEPAPKTVEVRWITVRNVSSSSGSSESLDVSTSALTYTRTSVGAPSTPPPVGGDGSLNPATRLEVAQLNVVSGGTFAVSFYAGSSLADGTYSWDCSPSGPSLDTTSGSFVVLNSQGTFSVNTLGSSPLQETFTFKVMEPLGGVVAISETCTILAAGSEAPATPSVPPVLPPPVDVVRDPWGTTPSTSDPVPVEGMFLGGVTEGGVKVYVRALPFTSEQFGTTYDPPANSNTVWTSSDLTSRRKDLISRDGALKTYFIW